MVLEILTKNEQVLPERVPGMVEPEGGMILCRRRVS